ASLAQALNSAQQAALRHVSHPPTRRFGVGSHDTGPMTNVFGFLGRHPTISRATVTDRGRMVRSARAGSFMRRIVRSFALRATLVTGCGCPAILCNSGASAAQLHAITPRSSEARLAAAWILRSDIGAG